MQAGGFVARRARAHGGPLLVLLLLAAAIAAVCAGTVGDTRAATVATVRQNLATASPEAAGIQVQTRLAGDPAAQDDVARVALADLFPGVRLEVVRSLRSTPTTGQLAGREVSLVLGAEPDLAERGAIESADVGTGARTGTVVDPGPGEAFVPEAALTDLGLSAGDSIEVDGAVLTVTGTWRPADPDHPGWFGAPTVPDDASGPVLVDTATLRDVVDAPFVRWTVHPEPAALTPADLAVLEGGAQAAERVLREDDGVNVRGVTVTGRLAETAAATGAATSAAGAVGLAPVVLLSVVSLVALVQVVRLLARTREVEVLLARGAAPAQVTRWAVVEGTVVAVLGAGAGTALAAVLVTRQDAGREQLPLVVAVGVATAVVTVLVALAVHGLQARRLAARQVTDRSGRLPRAAELGAVVLTTVAAALAAWQLLRHGTPVVGDLPEVDPLAVSAPAAVLVALTVLGMGLLTPVLSVAQRLVARHPRLGPVLGARQLARRLRSFAVPVVLLGLAGGAVTTAAAFQGTAATQREQVTALAAGADVRVLLPESSRSRGVDPSAAPAAPYADLDGVTAAASVLRHPATVGDRGVVLVTLPRAPEVVRAPDELGLSGATGRLAPGDGGVALPDGATGLELRVRVHAAYPDRTVELAEQQDAAEREAMGRPGTRRLDHWGQNLARLSEEREIATAVWVSDQDGGLSRLDGGTLTARPLEPGAAQIGPDPTEHTVAVELPHPGSHRLVGVEVSAPADWSHGYELGYEVVELRAPGGAGAADLEGTNWVAARTTHLADVRPLGPFGVRATVVGDGLSITETGTAVVRLVPAEAAGPVPAVVSAPLAERHGLSAGDQLDVALAGPEVSVQVVGVVAAVPGSLEQDAVLVDQATLGRHLLHERRSPLLPTEVWLAVDDAHPENVAAAARELVDDDGQVHVAGEDVVDSTSAVADTFWLAAAGAAVLALVGVAAVALTLTRQRRGEVVVLRALGASPAGQARTRAGELVAVGGAGLALGVAAGWGTAVLLLPTLVRAAATETAPLPLPVHLATAPGVLVLLSMLVGLLAVSGAVALRVHRQARDVEYREEVR